LICPSSSDSLAGVKTSVRQEPDLVAAAAR
jgi:hypothetical protein